MRRIVVRSSPVHVRGVFALTRIRAGEKILEYKGKLVSWREAQRQYARSAAEEGHTFFFDLDDGRVIDGEQGGNSARWINHRDQFLAENRSRTMNLDSAIVTPRVAVPDSLAACSFSASDNCPFACIRE